MPRICPRPLISTLFLYIFEVPILHFFSLITPCFCAIFDVNISKIPQDTHRTYSLVLLYKYHQRLTNLQSKLRSIYLTLSLRHKAQPYQTYVADKMPVNIAIVIGCTIDTKSQRKILFSILDIRNAIYVTVLVPFIVPYIFAVNNNIIFLSSFWDV